MQIFKLLGEIVIDASRAERSLDAIAQRAGTTGDKVRATFEKIGGAATSIMTGVGVVGAAMGGAWLAAIEGTREYRTQLGMLDTAFQASGHSSEAAKQTYSDLNAVLGDSGQATEAAQMLAVLADNEKELTTWTDICTGVYARMGEAIPLEELAQSSSETAKSGILTGGLVDALIQAGHSEEEFQAKLDACTGEQERQKLIMDTLNGSYSEASKQYKETNKDVLAANRAQEKLTDAMADLGRVGEPILTAIKTKVAEMVTAAVPHLQNLVNKVKDVKKWVQDNQETIGKWKAAIVGATAAIGSFTLILKWGAIMGAAKTAIMGVRTGVLLLNAAMRANIIGLIVSLIIGLVAAFVTLWKNNEGFRNFWIKLWDKIKSACSTAVTGIKNKFNDLKDAAGRVKSWFEDIRKSISDKIDAAKDSVDKAIKKIKGFFPLKIGKIFSNLQIPKISVSGGKAPFGIAGKGNLPKFNVKWNAEGAVLNKPTIFGRIGDTLLGGGEAGKEAIAPIDVLQGYVTTAVKSENRETGRIIIEQFGLMMDFLRENMPHVVQLDSGEMVGALLPAVDVGLADRWAMVNRGVR